MHLCLAWGHSDTEPDSHNNNTIQRPDSDQNTLEMLPTPAPEVFFFEDDLPPFDFKGYIANRDATLADMNDITKTLGQIEIDVSGDVGESSFAPRGVEADEWGTIRSDKRGGCLTSLTTLCIID